MRPSVAGESPEAMKRDAGRMMYGERTSAPAGLKGEQGLGEVIRSEGMPQSSATGSGTPGGGWPDYSLCHSWIFHSPESHAFGLTPFRALLTADTAARWTKGIPT